jgi:predicted AlkP superfamily phosphohydrolase/phosphomutase
MNQQRRTPRILVIGLDGATYDLLQPMIQAGWLPNVQRALNEGAHGVLRSTVPPLTAPAWTSFQTGLNPGRHGVFSFQRRLDVTLEREFVNSTAIHGPRLWHWLAQHGLTSGVINLPMTWPPQPMPTGSYLVSGMETPSTDHPFTDPPELADELRARGYICDLRVKLHERDFRSAAGVTAIAVDLLEVLRRREAAIFKLLAERPTDALVVVFETPDRLQHWAWQAIEEALVGEEAIARTPLHEAVAACYRELDRVVGRLLNEAVGPDSHVLFVSDHGFGPLHSRFHVDQWLAQQGWLAYAGGKATVRQRLRGPLQRIKRLLPRSLLLKGRRTFAVSRIINWQQTRAYSGPTMEHAVYINLRGREPEGVVAPDDFDALRQEIAQALLAVRDPRAGRDEPVVQAAALREQLYQGPFVAEAPDMVFTLAPGYEPTSELSSGGVWSDARSEGAGIHQPAGILILLGPGVTPGARLPDQNMVDVLPTMLYALGLPVSTALDGAIVKTAFDPAYLAAHPPLYSDAPGPDKTGQGAPVGYSPEDAAQIEARLAALGYLS